MKGLHEWMGAQSAGHKTEPNSGLGKAISYLRESLDETNAFPAASRRPDRQQHCRTGPEEGHPEPQLCVPEKYA
jgi:hypothetical protein